MPVRSGVTGYDGTVKAVAETVVYIAGLTVMVRKPNNPPPSSVWTDAALALSSLFAILIVSYVERPLILVRDVTGNESIKDSSVSVMVGVGVGGALSLRRRLSLRVTKN